MATQSLKCLNLHLALLSLTTLHLSLHRTAFKGNFQFFNSHPTYPFTFRPRFSEHPKPLPSHFKLHLRALRTWTYCPRRPTLFSQHCPAPHPPLNNSSFRSLFRSPQRGPPYIQFKGALSPSPPSLLTSTSPGFFLSFQVSLPKTVLFI